MGHSALLGVGGREGGGEEVGGREGERRLEGGRGRGGWRRTLMTVTYLWYSAASDTSDQLTNYVQHLRMSISHVNG